MFPFLRIKVRPVKGSALVWYNLHSTGHRDWRTKHAGCPVRSGSKWSKLFCLNRNKTNYNMFSVSTIWIHERQQLLSRPCGTDKFEWLKSQGYIDFFANFV